MESKMKGLSVFPAAFLIVASMAGSGVVALPHALLSSGWYGLLIIVFFTINDLFIGTRIACCWTILESRYKKFEDQVRDPYPEMAERAFGKIGRVVCLVLLTIEHFGVGCVLIVLIAQLVTGLFGAVGIHFSICIWMAIASLILTPLTYFGRPKDLWPIAVGGFTTTVTACVLIMVNIGMMATEIEPDFPTPNPHGFFEAFGTIMFCFSGIPIFPTIQADMRDKSRFKYAAILAIVVLFVIYFPMAAVGYFSLGSLVQDNIVLSMTEGWMKITVQVLLLLQLITAFPIVTNTPFQLFEEIIGIPLNLNIWRCVFRTFSVSCLLFIAESVPNFGAILGLVGGSTVTFLTFVFPSLFYIRISDATIGVKGVEERRIAVWERFYCLFLILVGIVGGSMATYNTIRNIVDVQFSPPCYMQLLQSDLSVSFEHRLAC